ncbi:DUF2844 domain-containing protein [Paraburkholderia sprentiae WSM5005]|uniref:DUF2844 domain-containing protein n=1 Tax=Paraburkholderia sprentiae WSM5005 TaxID=754502 RepID=A0A1I9YL94_9BURK|nr:DUF2844 domain-containing protein [Paraburkholderia sprentiae]APA87077.1 DUF2844 domain-containing protein [Paraburkholderia sprentiae WSM5005]
MWSRVRRAGKVTALVSLALLAARSAYAELGGAPITPPLDASVSSRIASRATSSYTVRETALANGTVIREYLDARGAVFGVAWHGPRMPDLSDLLGSYFPQYIAGAQAAKAARGGGRGPVAVERNGLVARSGGHMGALSGQVWLTPALPVGVSGSDIE